MEIINKFYRTTSFDSLNEGAVFICNGIVYMKTTCFIRNNGCKYNAVVLEYGTFSSFSADHIVYIANCKLVID